MRQTRRAYCTACTKVHNTEREQACDPAGDVFYSPPTEKRSCPAFKSWTPQKLSIRRMMRITMRHLRFHPYVAQTHSCAVSCAVAVAALWCLKFFSKTVSSPLLLLSRFGRGVCILEKSKNQVSTGLPALTPS